MLQPTVLSWGLTPLSFNPMNRHEAPFMDRGSGGSGIRNFMDRGNGGSGIRNLQTEAEEGSTGL